MAQGKQRNDHGQGLCKSNGTEGPIDVSQCAKAHADGNQNGKEAQAVPALEDSVDPCSQREHNRGYPSEPVPVTLTRDYNGAERNRQEREPRQPEDWDCRFELFFQLCVHCLQVNQRFLGLHCQRGHIKQHACVLGSEK